MVTSDPFLRRFATQHSVELSHLPEPECDGIRCILRCIDALDAEYLALPQHLLESDPTVGLLRHVLARCAEKVEGAIIAFATASGSATEVLSRAAIEADAVTYRTVYARLCAETHFDAEETLRYLMGSTGGEILLQQMAAETIAFSRLLLTIAVCYHLRAVGAYATRYDMLNAARECRKGVVLMERWAVELSEHAGGMPG